MATTVDVTSHLSTSDVTVRESTVSVTSLSRTVDVEAIAVETIFYWFGPRQSIQSVREAGA